MMGRLNHEQGQLFYSFCLEEAVPDDHPFAGLLPFSTCPGSIPSLRPITPESVGPRSILCS
jgi:hypothetical protein